MNGGPPIIRGPKPKIPPPFFGRFAPDTVLYVGYDAKGLAEPLQVILNPKFEDKVQDAGFNARQTWAAQSFTLSTQLGALNAVTTSLHETVGDASFDDFKERVLKVQSIVEAANTEAGVLYDLVLEQMKKDEECSKEKPPYGKDSCQKPYPEA